MSDGTCAKVRDTRKLMRENMDSEIFFQKYTLSEETRIRLDSIKEMIKDDIAQANPMWKVVAQEDKEEICQTSEDSDTNDESNNNASQMANNQSMLQPSTQFYFTQVERTMEIEKSLITLSQKCDILESLCENLERSNGRLDLAQLENVSNDDLIPLMDELAEKLSLKGIYNMCCSISEMTIEQGMKYINILCTHLLLPKIVKLEQPSRLLSSAVIECIKKFPDEIQQFIFVPIFNADLKDTSLITTIVDTFDLQKKAVFTEKFLITVKELKLWHISILQSLLPVRFDHNMIDKITKLFSRKALCYCGDKSFGKFILSFLKVNTLSEEQKCLMIEVIAVNETLFRKPIENILRNM